MPNGTSSLPYQRAESPCLSLLRLPVFLHILGKLVLQVVDDVSSEDGHPVGVCLLLGLLIDLHVKSQDQCVLLRRRGPLLFYLWDQTWPKPSR